jgi:NAD(P)-dependent dehydrogenase (short-subunit alcohol dehydrogenase family)
MRAGQPLRYTQTTTHPLHPTILPSHQPTSCRTKQRGIRVNVLSPGVTDTPIIDSQVSTKEQADALREQFVQTIPLGRLGHAEEIATGILFLSCDDSSYMIGNDLFVSGGLSQI